MLVYPIMINLFRLIGEDFVIRQLQQLKTIKAIVLLKTSVRAFGSSQNLNRVHNISTQANG